MPQVGKEAQLGKVDDPWASSGHSGKASKHADGDTDAAELPEPLPTTLLDETLPITPRDLWRLVMGDPDFFRSVADMKKNRDLKIGRWRLSKGIFFPNDPCLSIHLQRRTSPLAQARFPKHSSHCKTGTPLKPECTKWML